MLTRPAAANHHKPPKKRRKYAGFVTMGIPAIRESIVLHRQGLATLKEPNYLLLSQILAVVCGGLRWFAVVCGGLPAFHCFHYLSSTIMVVICGGLLWLAIVCGGLSYIIHSKLKLGWW